MRKVGVEIHVPLELGPLFLVPIDGGVYLVEIPSVIMYATVRKLLWKLFQLEGYTATMFSSVSL